MRRRRAFNRCTSLSTMHLPLHSFCHHFQCILPVVEKPKSGHRRAQGARRVSAVKSLPKEKRSSERLSFDRLLPVTDLQPFPVADTRHYQLSHIARQSFRCCTAPGTTRKRANDSTTALQPIRRASARFSSHPQAGFIRGFLNERLWAFDATWVPFRWFHHIRPEQHRQFSRVYPECLPGQGFHSAPAPVAPSQNGLESLKTTASTEALTSALESLGLDHRRNQHSS